MMNTIWKSNNQVPEIAKKIESETLNQKINQEKNHMH